MAPNTDLCGTPHEVGTISEEQFPILMVWRLSVTYEENQRNAVPDMLEKRLMRMLWSLLSNAADRSSRVNAATLLSLLRLRQMS